MNTEVIVAFFSLIGTAIGTYGGIKKSNELVNHRLKELEKKVDKHNNVIERTFILENEVKNINEKIDDLEKDIKNIRRRS